MIRPGHVIADGFGRMAAKEDRPGVAHGICQHVRVGYRQFQMLRRDAVNQGRRSLQRINDDHRAEIAPARSGDVGALQRLQVFGDG